MHLISIDIHRLQSRHQGMNGTEVVHNSIDMTKIFTILVLVFLAAADLLSFNIDAGGSIATDSPAAVSATADSSITGSAGADLSISVFAEEVPQFMHITEGGN